MENNKNKIIHYRSKDTVDNKAKLPSADSLDYGELAINYANGVETIAFKNDEGEIVEIRSNEYIEGIIKNNEETTAASLTDLNRRLETVEELSEDSIPSIRGLEITSSGTLNEEQLAVLNNDPTVFVAEISQPFRGFALFGRIPVGLGDSDGTFAANIEKDYYIFNYHGNTYSITQTELALKSEIPAEVTESTVSGWGFTKNTGTVTGVKINGTTKNPSNGIVDLGTVLQSYTEQYKGTVTGVKINGTTKNPSNGVVDLGTVITEHQNISHLATKAELPTKTSDLTNDSGFITLSDVPAEQYKGTITGVSVNGTSVATSGVANIPAASTSKYGVTKLSSATNIDSEVLAATPKAVKAAYDLANSYKGTITEIKMNGVSKGASGVVDLGTVITEHQNISHLATKDEINEINSTITDNEFVTASAITNLDSRVNSLVNDKQDTLVSGTNIKTINGNTILGSGNLTIQTGEQNVQSDWIVTNTSSAAYIKNKPTSLKNPSSLTVGSKTYDGSSAVEIKATDLGLGSALKYLGKTSTSISDGSTTQQVAIGGLNITAAAGDVVIDSNDKKEYIWNGSKWEEFGNEGNYKTKQTAISSPTASSTASAFIDTISQDENGVISATKKNLPTGSTSVKGILQVGSNISVNSGTISLSKTNVTTALGYTPPEKDTTYENATTSTAGLMSSSDKSKLDGIATGATAVTESTVTGWGFTKNSGTYSKPSSGIPKADLADAVQTSLDKADTALQSYTEQYKGTITGVSANGTSVATSGVANIPAASTSKYGVTKLNSSTSSTSTTEAATPSAVKAAYDLANSYKGTITAVDTGDVLDDVNTEYATVAYVDGLVGDINSVLESIINS